ncbi:MAG: TetR/AcrR family transcriptional regulator [Candidatus Zixiibacteriota bacterium]
MNENLIVELENKEIVTPTFRRLSTGKKNKIYGVALEMFSRMTYDQVALDILANRAGVSKGSLFQYFDNKKNILEFISQIYFDYYSDFWRHYFENEQPVRARERLFGFFTEHFEYFEDYPVEYGFYIKMNYENSRDISGNFIELMNNCQLQYINAILSRGATVGEIRQDIESEEISQLLLIILKGLIRKEMNIEKGSRSNTEINARVKNIISFLFDGLAS